MAAIRRTLGVVPHVKDDASRAALEELCSLVGGDARMRLEPFLASSPAALCTAFHTGGVDFAWVSPTLLLLSAELANAVPLLTAVREGVGFFHALLFVAEASPIASVEDLSGRSAAWVARTSASGYILPRLGLARRGFDVRAGFSREV